jgi:hypothetical protein
MILFYILGYIAIIPVMIGFLNVIVYSDSLEDSILWGVLWPVAVIFMTMAILFVIGEYMGSLFIMLFKKSEKGK